MDLIQQISKGNYDQIHVGQGGRGLYTTKGRTLIDRAKNEASSTGRSKVFFMVKFNIYADFRADSHQYGKLFQQSQ